MSETTGMTVGRAARAVGVTARTLRPFSDFFPPRAHGIDPEAAVWR